MPAPSPQLPSPHGHVSAGASPGSRLWQRARASGSLRPVGSAPHLPSAASAAISGGSGSLRGGGSGSARGPAVQDPSYSAEQGGHLQAAGGEQVYALAPDPRVAGSSVGVPSLQLAVHDVRSGVLEEQYGSQGVLLGASPDGSCALAGVQGELHGKAASRLRSREGEDSAMEIGGAAGDVNAVVSLPDAAHQQGQPQPQLDLVAAQDGILGRLPSSTHPDDVATLISTEVALAAAAASRPSHGDGEGHLFSSELCAEQQAAVPPAEVGIQSLDGCEVAGGGWRHLRGPAHGAAAIPGTHECEEEEDDVEEDEDSEVDDSSDDCFSLALDMGPGVGAAALPGRPSPHLPFPQPPAVLAGGPMAAVPGAVVQLPLDIDLYGCDVADLQDLEDLMSLEEVEAATGAVPADAGAVQAGASPVPPVISPVGAAVVQELMLQESGGLGPRPPAGVTVPVSSMAGEGDGSSRTAGNSPVGVGAAGVRLQHPGALGSAITVGGALPLQVR